MFLSIIIPVYNADKYLRECLESCLTQDIAYDEYEIICVNDGSTDNSAIILNEYESKFPNIQVLQKWNGGVSSARNAGITVAKGDYLWFVDADDFIQENILMKLYETATQNKLDKISFNYYEFLEYLTEEECILKKQRLLKYNTNSAGYVICSSLFRRELIEKYHIRFRTQIFYGEDGMFCYEYNRLITTSCVVDDIIYFYRRNNTSATRTYTQEAKQKRLVSALTIAKVMLEYIVVDKMKFSDYYAPEAVAVLMPGVRSITIKAAELPKEYREEVLCELRRQKLFPLFLYRNPRDWFPKRIHMNTAYKGFKGKVLDILNFYSTTRFGFWLLCAVNSLYKRYNK